MRVADAVSKSGVILCILLFFAISASAQDESPWSFRFGWGPVFPDAAQLVGANSPNGINISASMAYRLNSRIYTDFSLHFDYFTDDLRTDYKTYIVLFSPLAEIRLHALPAQSRISPYLIGAAGPSLFVNTKPGRQSDQEIDPYSDSREYEINAGYSLKYGLGSNIALGKDIILWLEWRYNRFGFLSSRDPILYRIFMFGLLLDIEWLF